MATVDDSLYDRIMRAYNAFKGIGTTGGFGRFGEALGDVVPDLSAVQGGLDPTQLGDRRMMTQLPSARDMGVEPPAPVAPSALALPSVADLQQGARAMQAGGRAIGGGGTFGQAANAVDQQLPPALAAYPEPPPPEEDLSYGATPRVGVPAASQAAAPVAVNLGPSKAAAPKAGVPPEAGPQSFRLRPGEVPLDQIQAIIGAKKFNPYVDGKLVNGGGPSDPFLGEVGDYMKTLNEATVPEPQVRIGPGGQPFIDYSATMQAKTQLQNAYQAALDAKGRYLSQQQANQLSSSDRRAVLEEKGKELAQSKADQEMKQLLEAGRQNPALWSQVEYKQKIGVPLTPQDKLILQQREHPGLDIPAGLEQIQAGYAPGTSRLSRMFDASRFGMAPLTPQQNVERALSGVAPDQAAEWRRIAEALGIIPPVTGRL